MTAYSDLTPLLNMYVEGKILRSAGPVQVLQHTALMKSVPKNKTQTIGFRRYNPLVAATSPLVEGVTPTASQFTKTDVVATLKQYGYYIPFTDVIEDTHTDPVVNEMAKHLGENVGRTIEELDWAVVRGGSAVIYGNGSARTDVNTPITLAKLRAAERALKRNKAMMHREAVMPGANYATFAIEPSWIVVAHTDLGSDIRNLPNFIPTVKYGQKNRICDEEIGAFESFRFLLSPDLDVLEDAGGAFAGSGTAMVSTTGVSADVYPMVVFGRESWGRVALELRGQSVVPMISRPKPSPVDPLAQRGTAGCKFWHAAVRLNEAWMQRIEVAATKL